MGLDIDEPGIGKRIAEVARRYGVDNLNVLFLTPLPGTRLWDQIFKFEISWLADSLLMKIEENVNPGTEKREFSKIPFDYLTNMQSQIVVCDRSRNQRCWVQEMV